MGIVSGNGVNVNWVWGSVIYFNKLFSSFTIEVWIESGSEESNNYPPRKVLLYKTNTLHFIYTPVSFS